MVSHTHLRHDNIDGSAIDETDRAKPRVAQWPTNNNNTVVPFLLEPSQTKGPKSVPQNQPELNDYVRQQNTKASTHDKQPLWKQSVVAHLAQHLGPQLGPQVDQTCKAGAHHKDQTLFPQWWSAKAKQCHDDATCSANRRTSCPAWGAHFRGFSKLS